MLVRCMGADETLVGLELKIDTFALAGIASCLSNNWGVHFLSRV